MILERDKAVGLDTGLGRRADRARGLLMAATVMFALLGACELPGPGGADAVPRGSATPVSDASGIAARSTERSEPMPRAQPAMAARATPAQSLERRPRKATPGAAAAPDLTQASERRPARAETAAPNPSATRSDLGQPTPFPETLTEELRGIVRKGITQEFPRAESWPVHVLPLKLPMATGMQWWVVTSGPSTFSLTSGSEVDDFRHFAAVYARSAGGAWREVDRLEIESAPQRTQVEVLTTGWEASAWIAVRGGSGAHARTLDVIGFDGTSVSTALSRITQGRYPSEFLDLDGDGMLEVVLDDSDPDSFCSACATKLQRVALYRWTGSQLERVELRAPTDQSNTQVARAVALAKADLWREAAAAAVEASRTLPHSVDVRWLSILVNRTAAARMNYGRVSGQPLLTQVFAGEYAAAADLMRALEPAQAFALDGPLIAGTAAEQDLSTMAVQLLDYTERGLAVAPERAEIHTVRALGLALASPDDLDAARAALAEAATLAPDDAFVQASRLFLESVERVPGALIEPPDEFLALLDGPSASFFAEGFTLGSGDRGRNVQAVQQRLARVPGLDFIDPGRYFDVFHELTRRAVMAFQLTQGLEPSGVVDAVTWEALEDVHPGEPDADRAAPAAWTAEIRVPRQAYRSQYRRVAIPPTPTVRFEPQLQPASDAAARPPAHAKDGQGVVYLTFDDGPHPRFTTPILGILARYDAQATFFALGEQIAQYPDLTRTLANSEHSLQNHTYSHPALNEISREAYVDEVTRTDAAIRAAAGDAAVPTRCLRPPYGAFDSTTASVAAELGKTMVLWNVDSQDWREPGADQIAQHVLSSAFPGAIILLHDGGGDRSQTVSALRKILDDLAARGFTFRIVRACDRAG